MSSDVVEPGWQRVLAWWGRLWNKSSDPVPPDVNAEPVAVWEDEGGASSGRPAELEKSPPGAPLDPTH